MNNGNGPDILGVCEVESRTVLEKLVSNLKFPKRRYKVAHADTRDGRGIDVAFIYDSKRYDIENIFSHWIVKRNATRDILQANIWNRHTGQRLVLIGNHWPSRSGGTLKSEPYRIIAGETLAYFNERIQDILGDSIPILVMGDFNDEPFDYSIMEHALATNEKEKLRYGRNPWLYNLMWGLLAKGKYTHSYRSQDAILDQFMVSKGFLYDNSKMSVKEDSVKIEKYPGMTSRGSPKRFGRPSRSMNKKGYSDHFPISVVLEES